MMAGGGGGGGRLGALTGGMDATCKRGRGASAIRGLAPPLETDVAGVAA